MIFCCLQIEVEEDVNRIPIVNEYADVFPQDFSGLPPH